MKQINFNAAGLDIGDAEIYVAVPEGRDEVSMRVFQTFTRDLYALANWLEACGVDMVAMESTGIYGYQFTKSWKSGESKSIWSTPVTSRMFLAERPTL